MNESLQVILFVMLVIVIVFFLILGVQVFFLLKDARRTLMKANKVLDETGTITESVSSKITGVSDIFGTLATGTAAARILKLVISTFANSDEKKREKGKNE
jgi:hypothetical protein